MDDHQAVVPRVVPAEVLVLQPEGTDELAAVAVDQPIERLEESVRVSLVLLDVRAEVDRLLVGQSRHDPAEPCDQVDELDEADQLFVCPLPAVPARQGLQRGSRLPERRLRRQDLRAVGAPNLPATG